MARITNYQGLMKTLGPDSKLANGGKKEGVRGNVVSPLESKKRAKPVSSFVSRVNFSVERKFLEKYNFQIRVTGILTENGKILLVKQKINSNRAWSLPGGRVEAGEKLDEAIVRELYEETGLVAEVERLIYVCDKTDCIPPILHITFQMKKIAGNITLPSNELDANPISDVKYIEFSELTRLGFSQKFVEILENGFPNAGGYMGLKKNIGL